MRAALTSLFFTLGSFFRSRASMGLEILALRHQLSVLQRRASKRPALRTSDRLFWVLLSRVWSQWPSALLIVKPETVIAWHRKGFRLYWTWKSKARPGRPNVSREVRELIRKMSTSNSLWGAPRIHGELLKLGIQISQAAVAKYMVRPRKPPSQTWRTFLENHVKVAGSEQSRPATRPALASVGIIWIEDISKVERYANRVPSNG